MKKILFLLVILVAMVSCSKDSDDEVSANYIEVNGTRHSIDTFVLNGGGLTIGSKRDGTYISFGYYFYDIKTGRRYYFADEESEFDHFEVWNNKEEVSITNGSKDSYYDVEENDDGTYSVEIVIKSPKLNMTVRHRGKAKE